MLKRLVSISTALAVVAAALVGSAASATAADNSLFDPGLIISDAVFYNSTTMSPSDIQAFLSTQGAGCVPASDGTPCLKDFTVTSPTRTSTYCQPYQGAANEPAAQVIYKVAQACGINPRVLLVTMQKEQTLVNRRTAGSAAVYAKAMGFACPDTAPCDPASGGFAVQVYLAANQFQKYRALPKSYRFQPNATNLIPYHPTDPFATNPGGCGGSQVTIRSQATAGLYNYTPYQPNAAALAAGAGLGDVCSTYGNRNFWRFFVDWFGSPVQQAPVGAADFVRGGNNVIALAGWAFDPDTTASIQVHVYVDGVGTPLVAAGSRPDVGAAYRHGDAHGFDVSLPASAGTHNVCLYAIDGTGGPTNTTLGCWTVTVANPQPIGNLETLTTSVGQISLAGWTLDPDTNAPIEAHVYVDGVGTPLVASGSRPDVDAAFGRGSAHGYAAVLPAAAGPHSVCVYAINTPSGPNTTLGCSTVTVPAPVSSAPIGTRDAVQATSSGVRVAGWALDPDTTASIQVHIYVDGVGTPIVANKSRPDVAAAYGKGDAHGFDVQLAASNGSHSVCLYAIDANGGPNTALGCSTVTVTNATPIGNLESVSTSAGQVVFAGWALDPDTSDPIQVHAYVDGVGTPLVAAQSRADVAAAFGKGDAHGFSSAVSARAGSHQFCVYAINVPSGANLTLGCSTVVVP